MDLDSARSRQHHWNTRCEGPTQIKGFESSARMNLVVDAVHLRFLLQNRATSKIINWEIQNEFGSVFLRLQSLDEALNRNHHLKKRIVRKINAML